MARNHWRKDIDPSVKDYLEIMIEEVHKHRGNYKRSKNPSAAQLWCALAEMSKQLFNMRMRIKVLERALKDSGEKPARIKAVPNKEERANLMKIAANPK